MKIVIPKKIKMRKNTQEEEYYNYEYLRSSKNVVIYKCVENGALETFNKKDFIHFDDEEKITMVDKNYKHIPRID